MTTASSPSSNATRALVVRRQPPSPPGSTSSIGYCLRPPAAMSAASPSTGFPAKFVRSACRAISMSMVLAFDLDDTLYDERRYVESGFRAVAADAEHRY